MFVSKNVIVLVVAICCTFSSRILFSDHSEDGELGFTTHIQHYGELIKLEDGIDLTGKDLRDSIIHRSYKELKNVNFSRTDLSRSNISETNFVNCSFRRSDLSHTFAEYSEFVNCDFTDASIGDSDIRLSKEQLVTTSSFRWKVLKGYCFLGDMSGLDFSGFDLKEASYALAKIDGCNLSDAEISRTIWNNSLSREQLLSTADFKKGELIGICFLSYDFSEMNLSQMNLTGCVFRYFIPRENKSRGGNFRNADLSDSVISQCEFWDVENLTLAQIKSTWNYKTGNMSGIKLPKEIQAALDAEQKAKEKPQ